MKQITFNNIHTIGNLVTDNAQIQHYHYPEMLSRYDSNFIEFKTLPSLATFKEVEKFLRDYIRKMVKTM